MQLGNSGEVEQQNLRHGVTDSTVQNGTRAATQTTTAEGSQSYWSDYFIQAWDGFCWCCCDYDSRGDRHLGYGSEELGSGNTDSRGTAMAVGGQM
jgi:hypothetical protein